jgi:hypothetical protein
MVGEMYFRSDISHTSRVLLTELRVRGVEFSVRGAQRISNHFSSVAVYCSEGKVLVGGHQTLDSFKKLFPSGEVSIKHFVGDDSLPFELTGHLLLPEGSNELRLTPWTFREKGV